MALSIENERGKITITPGAIANIAGIAATESYGVVGMGYKSKRDGIVGILRPDKLSKGINVELLEDETLSIDLHIVVEYGVNINAITKNIIDGVKYNVENVTGMKVSNITVFVDDIRLN